MYELRSALGQPAFVWLQQRRAGVQLCLASCAFGSRSLQGTPGICGRWHRTKIRRLLFDEQPDRLASVGHLFVVLSSSLRCLVGLLVSTHLWLAFHISDWAQLPIERVGRRFSSAAGQNVAVAHASTGNEKCFSAQQSLGAEGACQLNGSLPIGI